MSSSLPRLIGDQYEFHEWRHASAILSTDYKEEWRDVLEVLGTFRLHRSEILDRGGSKSKIAKRIDGPLIERGWKERSFKTRIVIDDNSLDSPT